MPLDDDAPIVQFRRSTGPTSDSTRWSFFSAEQANATPIIGRDGPTGSYLQALVNHTDADGYSLISVRYPPNTTVPRHSHDVAQIVVVLEGELRQGRRTFPVGSGYYSPAGAPYVVSSGDSGAHVLEFRHNPLTFTTDWFGPNEHIDAAPADEAGRPKEEACE